ncbi:hypothetical protein CZ794_07790 [Psychrobacter sp. JB385]|nr:hypothetical protein CZ794_07790 [Psychrobacter sp. JB385]
MHGDRLAAFLIGVFDKPTIVAQWVIMMAHALKGNAHAPVD